MAHTPGPWEAHEINYDNEARKIEITSAADSAKSKKWICTIFYFFKAESVDVPDNARLIAAAPDMYAALEEIAEGDGCNCRVGPGCDMKCKDIARAALAKAKGERESDFGKDYGDMDDEPMPRS